MLDNSIVIIVAQYRNQYWKLCDALRKPNIDCSTLRKTIDNKKSVTGGTKTVTRLQKCEDRKCTLGT